MAEVESELLRKKHIARFSPEEVCLLLEEMGFDRLDLRGFRVERVDGEAVCVYDLDNTVIPKYTLYR